VADSYDKIMEGIMFSTSDPIGRRVTGVTIEKDALLFENLTPVVVTDLFRRLLRFNC
jgi:hypothetical protein